jgi:hypothetical protein
LGRDAEHRFHGFELPVDHPARVLGVNAGLEIGVEIVVEPRTQPRWCEGGWRACDVLQLSERMNVAADETPEKYLAAPSQ